MEHLRPDTFFSGAYNNNQIHPQMDLNVQWNMDVSKAVYFIMYYHTLRIQGHLASSWKKVEILWKI